VPDFCEYDSECSMFVPCIARRCINNQHYALNYITSLFNVQAPTCYGSSLLSPGSFLDPCELFKQICGVSCNVYVTCVPECCSSGTPAHRPHKHYMIYHLFIQVNHTDLRSSLMMADCCRNM
jgi:hypothetical protein